MFRTPNFRIQPLGNGFELGLHQPLVVREEILHPHPGACRVAYVSDIHLRRGRSEILSHQLIKALLTANADLILLGGDLVDQPSEIPALHSLVTRMTAFAPVFAIPGNHDTAVGEPQVRDSVVAAGGRWIQSRPEQFHHHTRVIEISGPKVTDHSPADVRILCAHNPRIWKTARTRGFDLVLAGHLHGCQVVGVEAWGRLFPGALFYPHNHIRQSFGASHLRVAMGCSDLIPIRWGCPREILVCVL